MSITPDPLLNVQQIKQKLSCSISYVYRLIDDGRLSPFVKLGHRRGIRVRKSVVENFLLELEENDD